VLRDVRVQARVSVRRLARDLDRAHSTISDFENGRRLPGVEVVEQYEDYFGLSRGTLGAQRERARAERLESPRDATLEENLGDIVCPYMGLRAFEPGDAALFCGRETQAEDVLARLGEARFVAVVGASGSGKSSFVRAGLVAGLSTSTANGSTSPRVALMAPGEHPLDELTNALSAVTGDSVPVAPGDLRADPAWLQRAARQAGERGLVIVVDQFEELFTLCDDDIERAGFIDALVAAWRDSTSHVVVIIALRADFYARVAAYPELAAAVVAHQTLIGPLGPAELRRAIELPAAQTGVLLQPGLTDTILEDLAGEPGALPLLSHALLETWKRRRRLMLTVGGYREAGGVRGAIAQTAEDTLQVLPEADQQIARSIFLSLTDVAESTEPTRRRVDRADLAVSVEPTQRDRVLSILAAARLVTIDERTVTVAHEALIRHWPRLRGWIETDRAGLLTHRRLTAAAREWDALQREPAALYRGARLATAREWADDHADDLSRLERDFLTASQAGEQRRTRRLRILAAGLAASTLIVAALAAWALNQRANARTQASNRTSLALASLSNGLLTTRPDVSLALAFEAYREVPRPEARSAVIRAILAARRSHLRGLRTIPTALGAVALSPDAKTLASVGRASTVRLWDVASGKQVAVLHGQDSPVRAFAFRPDGKMLASVGGDTVRLWDVTTGTQRNVLHARPGAVSAIAFSPDGKLLASAGDGDAVRLWDVTTGTQRNVLHVHATAVSAVAFSHDGKLLASTDVAHHSRVRLWDLATGTQRAVLRDAGAGPAVAFSPDDKTLACTSQDSVRLWDLASRTKLAVLQGNLVGLVRAIAFSSDGRTLTAASFDGTISLWDPAIRRQRAALLGHHAVARTLAFSPDGKLLASADDDGNTMRVWDSATRKQLAVLHARADVVAFSRDGKMLASRGRDGTIRLWNAATGKQLAALPGQQSGHPALAFSPDGKMLASTDNNSTVTLWNLTTRTRLAVLHHRHLFSVAFNRDGKMLASTDIDDTVRLWDPATGKRLAVLPGHRNITLALAVAFSPDGKTLAVANSDTTVILWNLATRKQLAVLHGHTRSVTAVAFSNDGRTLATASDDKTVRLWDPATQTLLVRLTGHTAPVGAIAFSPDDKTLASASTHMKLLVWHDLLWQSRDELHATVCDILLTGLSRSDSEQYAPGIPYHRSCP
jgi:WD40 repeat protein/transcriptional regulator with XRE-family HTH domain